MLKNIQSKARRTYQRSKSAILTFLAGWIAALIVMGIGTLIALSTPAVIGLIAGSLATVVSVIILLFSLDLSLNKAGVNTHQHLHRLKLALRRFKRGFSRASRRAWSGARTLYKRFKRLIGGLR